MPHMTAHPALLLLVPLQLCCLRFMASDQLCMLCLCCCSKTRFCVDLMREHVVKKGYWASVYFMSHTSSDPSVGLSGDIVQGGHALSYGLLLTLQYKFMTCLLRCLCKPCMSWCCC